MPIKNLHIIEAYIFRNHKNLYTQGYFIPIHSINFFRKRVLYSPKTDRSTREFIMDPNSNQVSLSYKDAGVNIDAGNAFVNQIKHITKSTHRPEVMANIGGFGGLFSLAQKAYKKPILVSGTDGVGTKLKLAQMLNQHDTIGIDLVAMCVNDIIVLGAEPLFFLDYFATGKLSIERATDVIKGIGEGCRQSGCALIGGETAEMPGMYHGEDYDLAGFAVGIVEEEAMIDGSKICPGDVLIGLSSSGPHSNGYSLIRKVIEINKTDLNQSFGNSTLGKTLLAPTKIYVKTILELVKQIPLKAIAHITGGGILENLPRVLPEYSKAVIDLQNWLLPEIFQWLQKAGNITKEEMYRTFNCGIGMVIAVDKNQLEPLQQALKSMNEDFILLGYIAQTQQKEPFVEL